MADSGRPSRRSYGWWFLSLGQAKDLLEPPFEGPCAGQRRRREAGIVEGLQRFLRSVVVLGGVGVLVASPAVADPLQQLRVHWDVYPGAPSTEVPLSAGQAPLPASDVFTLLDATKRTGVMRQQRDPELSADQLVVFTVNAADEEMEWFLIPDPRIIRGEMPDATGQLQGATFHRASADFIVTFPEDPTVRTLRFYQPRWTATGWQLDRIGTLVLP
jgi:hypothetical protein